MLHVQTLEMRERERERERWARGVFFFFAIWLGHLGHVNEIPFTLFFSKV